MKSLLLENFEALADAPSAIPRLRQLILQLAVRARLVPQIPMEEPVPIGPQAPPHLPSSWRLPELGGLLEVQNGYAFESRFFNTAGDGLPLVRIRDIMNATAEVHYSGPYREEFVVGRGDILIGMDGNFNISRWRGGKALLNQRVCRLKSFSEHVAEEYVLRGLGEQLEAIRSRSKSYTTVTHLSAAQVRAIRLPIPPLAEQKRIIAKVDELMARCDELEAKQQAKRTKLFALNRAGLRALAEPSEASLTLAWRRVRDHFDHLYATLETVAELRQTILGLAVRGHLTPEFRVPHKGDVRVNVADFAEARRAEYREQSEGLRGQGRTVPRLPDVAQIGSGARHPEGWLQVALESAALFVIDCPHSTPRFGQGGAYCVDTTCIEPFRVLWERARCVDMDQYRDRTARLVPTVGDVLFSREGTIGTAAVLDRVDPVCLGQRMMLFRFPRLLDPAYAAIYLQSSVFKEELEQHIKGTAAKHINIGSLRKLPFAVPPLEEQKRIVARVDELLGLCDDLEMRLRQTLVRSDELLAAVMREIVGGAGLE